MSTELESFNTERLDTLYPVEKLYENLEEEFLNVYANIPLETEYEKPVVILLSGLSGGGKDTVLKPLVNEGLLSHVVTATTRERRDEIAEPEDAYIWMRARRKGEQKKQYHKSLIQEYGLIEKNFHYGNLYGLPLSSLKKDVSSLQVVRTDINGVKSLRKMLPTHGFRTISVGVLPTSWNECYDSILGRGCEDDKKTRKRILEDFKNTKKYLKNINYFIVNSRETYPNGISGLDISISGLRNIVKKYGYLEDIFL